MGDRQICLKTSEWSHFQPDPIRKTVPLKYNITWFSIFFQLVSPVFVCLFSLIHPHVLINFMWFPVGNAWVQRQQFYPSVVYITKSNPSMAVIYLQVPKHTFPVKSTKLYPSYQSCESGWIEYRHRTDLDPVSSESGSGYRVTSFLIKNCNLIYVQATGEAFSTVSSPQKRTSRTSRHGIY